MKKTLTVNLNNIVFHIDNDAYDALHNYLSEVESRLSEAERKEVMADIEARIAELFTEKLSKGKHVVTNDDVDLVISVLGKPNQFSSEDVETESEDESGKDKQRSSKKGPRKFYRDEDNAVLGGVAAGLAAYLGWDVAAIRIILVVLLFLSYSTLIPVYIIFWIIAPAARTVAQKLEMQGEPVTAERIKEEINSMKSYVNSEEFERRTSSFGSRLGGVIRAIIKVFLGVVGTIMGFVGFVVLSALLFALSIMIFEPAVIAGFSPQFHYLTAPFSTLLIIAMLLMIGIPVFVLIYGAIRIISGKKGGSRRFGWLLLVLWVIGIFLFAGMSGKTVVSIIRGDASHFSFYWDRNSYETDITRDIAIADFHSLDVTGNVKVFLVQDSVFSLKATGSPTALSHLKTGLKDGVLKISTEKFHVNRELKLLLFAPEIRSLKLSGASTLKGQGKFIADNMDIELTGFSKATMDVHVNRILTIHQLAASELTMEGMAYHMNPQIKGVSQFKAGNLLVRTATIKADGAAEINTSVTDSLDVEVAGAARFKNRYRPAYLHYETKGAASVKFN